MIGDVAGSAVQAGVRAQLDGLVTDRAAERRAAVFGVVPKRCGLCAHFNHAAAQEFLSSPVAGPFRAALGVIGLDGMGDFSKPTQPISEAAKALRPALTRRIEDYGLCAKNDGLMLWGFEEAPPVPGPEDPPCEDWL